jgi:hypothetical protein
MSRFLITLAAVVVAGAMYVAAAPGSQQAGPSAAQFKALKKEVGKLQKQVKSANDGVNLLADVTFTCMLHQTVGVAQRGDAGGTFGYTYTDPNPIFTTALDLSNAPTSTLLTLNPDPNAQCATLVGLSHKRSPAALAHWAKLHH